MTLLAAFQALLGRIAGTSDIAVACPVAGRNDPALEDLIGPFINTLPFRAKLEGSTSFRTLLSRTRTHVLEALAHSDVPFEKLVEELKLERSPGNGPFFEVFFQLRNFPEREVEFPGLSASPFVVDPGVTPFELALELWETRAGLGCSLDYSLDLSSGKRRAVWSTGIGPCSRRSWPTRTDRSRTCLYSLTSSVTRCSAAGTPLPLTCRLKRACTGCLRSNARALRRRSQSCYPTWMRR